LVASISVRRQGSGLEQANQTDFLVRVTVELHSPQIPGESKGDSIELSCISVPGLFRGGLVHESEQYDNIISSVTDGFFN
jgi:hypothetical protein